MYNSIHDEGCSELVSSLSDAHYVHTNWICADLNVEG